MNLTYPNGWPIERPHWSRKNPTKNHPKQLQTYNVPTCDVWNINWTNKGRDLQLVNKLRIVPRGTERMPQVDQRHWRATLHWSTYSQRWQDETKISRNCEDWQQKDIRYGPQSWIIACLKMFKISDEIMKFIEKTVKSWRVQLTAGRKNKQQKKKKTTKKKQTGRCIITIAICNSDHTTQRHTQEMYARIQT